MKRICAIVLCMLLPVVFSIAAEVLVGVVQEYVWMRLYNEAVRLQENDGTINAEILSEFHDHNTHGDLSIQYDPVANEYWMAHSSGLINESTGYTWSDDYYLFDNSLGSVEYQFSAKESGVFLVCNRRLFFTRPGSSLAFTRKLYCYDAESGKIRRVPWNKEIKSLVACSANAVYYECGDGVYRYQFRNRLPSLLDMITKHNRESSFENGVSYDENTYESASFTDCSVGRDNHYRYVTRWSENTDGIHFTYAPLENPEQERTFEWDVPAQSVSVCNGKAFYYTVDKHIMVFDLETETYIAELTFLEN